MKGRGRVHQTGSGGRGGESAAAACGQRVLADSASFFEGTIARVFHRPSAFYPSMDQCELFDWKDERFG